jgi:hypothetical protein
MSDIFAAWREAVNLGCVGLTGDEACAGYYRMQDLGGFTEASSQSVSWLPVAIWWGEDDHYFVCLVDGQECDVSIIWPKCRSYPVSYETYYVVAEEGGAWPDGLMGAAFEGAGSSLECFSETEGSSGTAGDDLSFGSGGSISMGQPVDMHAGVIQSQPESDGVVFSIPTEPSLTDVKGDYGGLGGMPTHEVDAPLASLGHNLETLPKDLMFAETLADLERDCFAWFDKIGFIQTQKQADEAGGFAERFSRLEKDAEDARTSEKRPVLAQGRTIDAKWKPIVAGAAEGKKRMKRALEPYLIAERERLERQALLSGEALDLEVNNPKAGLYGRKISLRSSYVLSITDEEALRDYFARDNRFWRDKEVRSVFKRLAEADLQAGRDVPGAQLEQALTAA